MDPSLNHWRNVAKSYPLLDHAEVVVLAKRVEQGDQAAMDRLVNCNLRLVLSVAWRYARRASCRVALDDLVMEGNLGLIRAISKFDWRRGVKLSTYAMNWIRQAISRASSMDLTLGGIGTRGASDAMLIRGKQAEMVEQSGRPVSIAEVAERLGFRLDKAEALVGASEPLGSLDVVLAPGGDNLVDLLGDSSAVDPLAAVLRAEDAERVRAALQGLSTQQREALVMRYGLSDDSPKTLSQVGKVLGMSRQGVSYAERIALPALRQAMQEAD